jgi:hypothetical protein
MKLSRLIIGTAMAVALSFSAAEQGLAMEMFGDVGAALHSNDGYVTKVVVRRGGGCAPRGCGHRGGTYHHGGAYRGGAYRGGAYHGGAYRGGVGYHGGIYRGGVYGGAWRGGPWVRSYGWPVGGAVAAGAAIGFIGASAATWAPAAPQAGLCWYYTDASQRQGFWDNCP